MQFFPHVPKGVRAAIGGLLVFLGAAIIGYSGLREIAVGRLGIAEPAERNGEVASDAEAWEWLLGAGGLAGGIALIRGRRSD